MAVAGLRGTGDWGPDERPKNFREMILWLNPNGTAPIFALSAKIGTESVNDPEFSWWDEPNDLVRLQVAGALGTTDTLVTVDSGDPTAAVLDARWGKATHLVPGDLLLVEPATDAATFDHEIIRVTAVHSETQFTVVRGAAGTTAAAIGNDLFLLKIGTTFAEGTASPQSATRNPIKYSNLTQIFKHTYEITGTADATHARTGDARSNDKRRRSFDHARDIEFSIMFGRKNETTGSNGKPQRTMDGLRSFIPAGMLTANWSIAGAAGNSLLDQISPVFDWDSKAGNERIAFCGNGALNKLNEAIFTGSGVGASTINFNGSEQVFKMNFQRLSLPQGDIFLRTHPLMSRHPIYTNSMFILDMSAIKWRPLRGRDTKSRDDIQNKDEDLRRGEWMTEAGIEVQHGGLTMKYIGGFGTAIA